ncbi:MAG: BamA/TamA family outer membrane protein [Phaeodactylibacter sp.]|nr:BamA/TamA family outer membrane protein [Phaeodactylibacter sp.]MCB9051763.1 BamA/TamA family outer membrane protein [Lewinellaceae bacterium]
MKAPLIYASCVALLAFSTACNPTRRIQEGQLFYQGATAKFEGRAPEQQKQLEAQLLAMARPVPNESLLGLYPRLGIYNLFANKKRGIGKWLQEKLGRPPVTYNPELVERSRLRMEKYLKDDGYLQASVRYDTLARKKKIKVAYYVQAGGQYTIGSVDWPEDSTALQVLLEQEKAGSLLKTGQPYQLSQLEAERERLAQSGIEQGFFQLSKDNFYYFLDTTLSQNQVGLYLRVAPPQDGRPFHRHYIGKTTLYPTFLLDEQNADLRLDTLERGRFTFIQSQEFVKLPALNRAVLQQEGELYVHSLQQKSVNRLLGLGPFKFVNLKYQLREEQDSLFLDRQFFLTPGLTQDFSAELEASSLESNSLGSALNINYTHRNFLGGAEHFSLGLSTGILTQLGSDVRFINSFDFSLDGQLSFPSLLIPFGLIRTERSWQARSTAALGTEFERRATQYTLQSFRGQFSYLWQPGRLQQHELSPLQLTWVNTRNTSTAFEERLAANPRLRSSFGNYFITSLAYQYNYNEQKPQQRDDYLYLSGRLEAAGNLSYALSSLLSPRQEGAYKFFGVPFAQFLRLEADIRYHHYLNRGSWIVRANLGGALPYGNSGAVPYIRQFFVGGANSIRAFKLRELGPGDNTDGFASGLGVSDQTGDIKLELNAEYRFPLFSYLHGAIFTDVGNIWLTGQKTGDPAADKGLFEWGSFYNELAVGAGAGLRLDITYFVLRLDLAFPLRRPFPDEGFRWVLREIAWGSRQWRQDNLVLNLALGYPF